MNDKVTAIVHFSAVKGHESALYEVLEYLRVESLKETGCLRFICLKQVDDESRFTFIEEWSDMSCFNDHLAAPHLAAADIRLKGLLTEPQQVLVYRTEEG